MDDQSAPKIDTGKPPVPVSPTVTGPASPAAGKPNFQQGDAQAILEINRLASASKSSSKKSIIIYTGIFVVAIVIALALSLFSHHSASQSTAGSNTALPNPTNNPLNNNGSISSQVKYCSNPVNAALVC